MSRRLARPNKPPAGGRAANGAASASLSPLDVLTLAEAAEYLHVSEDTLQSEAEAGRITGQRIGDEWRFLRECILTWLRTPRTRPRPPAGAGAGYTDEDPEAVIAAIYRGRKKPSGRG